MAAAPPAAAAAADGKSKAGAPPGSPAAGGTPPPAANAPPTAAAGAADGKSKAGPPPGTPPPAGNAPPAAANASPAAGAPAPNLGANKNDEPPFQMKMEPLDKIVFKSNKLTEGEITVPVKITNTTKTRQCYKVKTTSNDVFRVRPPLGFINVNETVTIGVSFIYKEIPPINRHFFAFYHATCKDDEKNCRNVWTPQAKPDGVRRVIVDFQKEDGTIVYPVGTTAPGDPPPAGNAPPAANAPAAGADGKSKAGAPPGTPAGGGTPAAPAAADGKSKAGPPPAGNAPPAASAPAATGALASPTPEKK